jgi:hypothetical protein
MSLSPNDSAPSEEHDMQLTPEEAETLFERTATLLTRAHALENDLLAFHRVQVKMAADVGYIRGAVELLNKRIIRLSGVSSEELNGIEEKPAGAIETIAAQASSESHPPPPPPQTEKPR